MGLEDPEPLDDGDGGGKSSVSCSICLDIVTRNGERSWAKLQCGHEFHLDCIGSAFNIKGAMQCPNCRKIEKGQWLYANGCRPFPDIGMEDWPHEEDLYDLSYAEMSLIRWCPYSGVRISPPFDEGDFPSSAYHDLLGQHAIFAEHTALSSATHPCPYVAYFGPIHSSSSTASGSVSDSSSFSSHWNGPSGPGDISSSYAFPAIDLHYHAWEHHSPPFSATTTRISGADQPSVPPVTQRAVRSNSDMARSGSFMPPFLVGHSHSAGRAGSSIAASPMIPPYPGSNARARDRIQALQAYYQQQHPPPMRPSIISGSRRSNGHRGLPPQVAPAPIASTSDPPNGFYFFPPSASSARNFQEPENSIPTRFHPWERDHLPSFPLNHIDRDSNWGMFHQPTGAAGTDSGMRSGSFRQRHGSDRTQSQNRS